MKGLVEEGQEHIQEHEKGTLRDVALAAAADKVEHYEISAYKSVRSLAKTVGQRAVAGLMQETLREEEQTDSLLLQIAQRLQQEVYDSEGEEEEAPVRAGRGNAAGKKTSAQSRGRDVSSTEMTLTDSDESSSRRGTTRKAGSRAGAA
jgi:hypothetical protein